MDENELKQLWKSSSEKQEAIQWTMKKNTEDIAKLKVRSNLSSMKPFKIFTLLAGIVWVAAVDFVLVHVFYEANVFFLISAILQVLLTKLAIGIYLYQIVLIDQVKVDEPVLSTQKKLAGLQSSTLWVTRLLFLQFPLWTTFYWNKSMLENGNMFLCFIQAVVTISFTLAAVWLFFNIKYENRNKKWFRLIFSGKEWDPVMNSLELLEQIDGFQKEDEI